MAPQAKISHAALQELEHLSQESAQVYPYFDRLFSMLDNPNSFVRTRGLSLIAKNAKWDKEGKLDQDLDRYLVHILDEKPITARQCIQRLSDIIAARPDFALKIRIALEHADFSHYPSSMQPLLQKACMEILNQIAILDADRNDK